MFFNAQISQMIKVGTIPCEVRVTVPEARHQCSPPAVEYTHSGFLL